MSVANQQFEVQLNIPSELALVGMVVNLGTALMHLRGYSESDCDSVRFAIHETLVNAIEYGGKNKPDARVNIKLYFDGPCFYADIEDEGDGFDVEDIPDPTQPENLLKVDGRGLFLVKELIQNFKVRRLPSHGVRVSFCCLKHSEDPETFSNNANNANNAN